MPEPRVRATNFTYSPTARRYRDVRDGRFVQAQRVNDALDTVLDAGAARARAATQRLVDGQSTVAQWQREMTAVVKDGQVAGSALGVGGWHQLSGADRAWMAGRVREQLDYLRNFAQQVASGQQSLDGTAPARAQMYAHAGRMTQREMGRRVAAASGHQYERNELGPADHCGGCLEETRRGWVPIGSLVPPGGRDCRTNCHCDLTYRVDEPSAEDRAA